MRRKNQICTLNLVAGETPRVPPPTGPTQQRLAMAFARLQEIDFVRNHRQDPQYGRGVEHQIVWRELLELEMQEFDEPMERTKSD